MNKEKLIDKINAVFVDYYGMQMNKSIGRRNLLRGVQSEVLQAIKTMPETEAIPIEWIEERMKKHGDYEESWNYRQLIEDWRKENEL